MGEVAIELLTFIVVFGGVCAALEVFLHSSLAPGAASNYWRSLDPVRKFSPAVDVMMEYRDVQAFRTLRRVRISQVLRNRAGRLYLLGFYEAATHPRTFRLDRVICFASLDGEVFDKRRFVLERLRLPAEMCFGNLGPARRSSLPTTRHSQIGTN